MVEAFASRLGQPRSVMRVPDEVATMLHLHRLGWGLRRIAHEVGCSPTTVQRYVLADGWVAFRSAFRPGVLAGLQGWLAERFRQHRGNADVVRQELAAEHGIAVSLRTVERAMAALRRELLAEALATIRFETPPGRQLQIDFGERQVWIGEESIRRAADQRRGGLVPAQRPEQAFVRGPARQLRTADRTGISSPCSTTRAGTDPRT